MILIENITAKKLYNVTEAGKVLGIGKKKVYDLINNGYLSVLDLGGLKVSAAELDRFISDYTGYSFKNMDNVTKLCTPCYKN